MATFKFPILINICITMHYLDDAGVPRIMADLLPFFSPRINEIPKSRAKKNHNLLVIKYFIQTSSLRIDAESLYHSQVCYVIRCFFRGKIDLKTVLESSGDLLP